MTHTEESLMALIDKYSCETARDYNGKKASEEFANVRLAISEVLAERDRYLDIIRREAWLEHAAENDVASPYVPFTDWVAEKNRAEKAEAELSFKAALVHELLPYQDRALKAEAELALLKDDNAKWKAGILNMPMKYKRMEFNAQLQRQVERAEAECERLREDLRGLEEVRREQAAGRDCWSAEIARLRKDAERYRWLRQPEAADLGPAVYSDDDCNTWLYGDELDAAIDAAMKEQP